MKLIEHVKQFFSPINYDAVLLFEELRESMQEQDSEHRAWSVCYLEIESNGQYIFNFSSFYRVVQLPSHETWTRTVVRMGAV